MAITAFKKENYYIVLNDLYLVYLTVFSIFILFSFFVSYFLNIEVLWSYSNLIILNFLCLIWYFFIKDFNKKIKNSHKNILVLKNDPNFERLYIVTLMKGLLSPLSDVKKESMEAFLEKLEDGLLLKKENNRFFIRETSKDPFICVSKGSFRDFKLKLISQKKYFVQAFILNNVINIMYYNIKALPYNMKNNITVTHDRVIEK